MTSIIRILGQFFSLPPPPRTTKRCFREEEAARPRSPPARGDVGRALRDLTRGSAACLSRWEVGRVPCLRSSSLLTFLPRFSGRVPPWSVGTVAGEGIARQERGLLTCGFGESRRAVVSLPDCIGCGEQMRGGGEGWKTL